MSNCKPDSRSRQQDQLDLKTSYLIKDNKSVRILDVRYQEHFTQSS